MRGGTRGGVKAKRGCGNMINMLSEAGQIELTLVAAQNEHWPMADD
jgi:hypothetical protein